MLTRTIDIASIIRATGVVELTSCGNGSNICGENGDEKKQKR